MKFKSKMKGSNRFSFRGMTSVLLKEGEISPDLSVIVAFDKTFKKLVAEKKIEPLFSPSEKSFLKESESMNVYQIANHAAKIAKKQIKKEVPKLDPIELARVEVAANVRTIDSKKAQLEYLQSITKKLVSKLGEDNASKIVEAIKKEFGLDEIANADLISEPSLLSEDTLDSLSKAKEETDKIMKEKTASLKAKEASKRGAKEAKKSGSKKSKKSAKSKGSSKVKKSAAKKAENKDK